MDTGINASHEDLIDHLWTNTTSSLKGTYGYDFSTDSADCSDTSGHGTHCAGVIAATTDNQKGIHGISNAKLMALKIFDDKKECYDSYIINALTYLQQAKAQFITGELDVDQDWDTYVNTVEQMNASRLLEIEQAAYDRFAALKG